MAGQKEKIDVELNEDHKTFIRTIKDQYNISTESKVIRIVMDYLQENNDVQIPNKRPISQNKSLEWGINP